jgi:hypothetical protein
MATKKVLLCSDFHCGHVVGLTHPTYQFRNSKSPHTKRNKFGKVQDQCWQAFMRMLDECGKVDAVLFHGDSIDGKGRASGGTETISGSMEDQADMAVTVFDSMRLKVFKRGTKLIGVHGTPYHEANNGEDWGNVVAERAGFDHFGAHEWIDIDGCVFDIKHKVGSSGIPHGRGGAIRKQDLWNGIWAEYKMQPRAHYLTRGHVHYYDHSDRVRAGIPVHLATLPALQAMGSKYGARQCDGIVDFGIVLVTVTNGVVSGWQPIVATINAQKAEAIKL